MSHRKNYPTYLDFDDGAYTLVTHTVGRNLYAVWKNLHTADSEELCWCPTKEIALSIIEALRRKP